MAKGCSPLITIVDPLACGTVKALTGAATGAVSGVLGGLVADMVKGETTLIKYLSTAFLSVPTPKLTDTPAVTLLTGDLSYLTAVVAIVGLLVAGGRLAWSQKADGASDAMTGLVRLLVVGGAGIVGITTLTGASDALSSWILSSTSQSTGRSISSMGEIATAQFDSSTLAALVVGLAILGIFVQLALLVARTALLVVLASVWPLSAAASMTPAGSGWFRKVTAWIMAAIVYKVAAAICFAAAFALMTSSTTGMGSIEGIVLLLISLVALPAVMKLVVPHVAAAGGIGTGAVVSAAAGAAVGAAMIAGTSGAAALAGGGKFAPGLISKAGGGSSPSGATSTAPPPPSGGSAPRGAGVGLTGAGAARAGEAGRAVHGALTSLNRLTESLTEETNGTPA